MPRNRNPSQLLLISKAIPPLRLTSRWTPHLHAINTLLHLSYFPNLVFLRTSHDHSRRPIRSIPAMLAILVLQRDALSTAQPLPISSDFFVNHNCLEAHKVTKTR